MSLHVEIIAVTLFRQNCTLMWDDETNEAVFTDVGGNVPRLLEEAEKRGLHVKAIWLKHGLYKNHMRWNQPVEFW